MVTRRVELDENREFSKLLYCIKIPALGANEAHAGNGPHPIWDMRIPLGAHVLRRLHQHGCSALHGVPGDYSLPFLSHLPNSKVKWVGSCNELNAGYAADAYARVSGLGALCTTWGVGELSALNAVAGSAAERVPVVHVVGMPSTGALWDQAARPHFRSHTHYRKHLHHNDGGYSTRKYISAIKNLVPRRIVFYDPQKPMDREDPALMFDNALEGALSASEPLYVGLPSDMSELLVESADRNLVIPSSLEGPETIDAAERTIVLGNIIEKITAAKAPLIMVDGLANRFGLKEGINKLVAATGIPTITTPYGLGVVSSAHENYYGVYTGHLGNADLHRYVQQSTDCVLLFGDQFSDTGTVGWTAVPNETAHRFEFRKIEVHEVKTVRKASRTNIKTLLDELVDELMAKRARVPSTRYLQIPAKEILPKTLHGKSPASKEEPPQVTLTQDYIYPRLSSWLRPRDTILLANGTPLIGAPLLAIPPDVRVLASGIWYSVGQMLPAAQGAALAQLQNVPETHRGRIILLEGDGGFQATAQELSTIIRHKLDMTIFIFNNKGYAYERLIQGPNAEYNDINDWDYTLAPALMGARNLSDTDAYQVLTRKVSTPAELDAVLADPDFEAPRGLKIVELKMGELDVPEYFRPALQNAGKRLLQVAPEATPGSGEEHGGANSEGRKVTKQRRFTDLSAISGTPPAPQEGIAFPVQKQDGGADETVESVEGDKVEALPSKGRVIRKHTSGPQLIRRYVAQIIGKSSSDGSAASRRQAAKGPRDDRGEDLWRIRKGTRT